MRSPRRAGASPGKPAIAVAVIVRVKSLRPSLDSWYKCIRDQENGRCSKRFATGNRRSIQEIFRISARPISQALGIIQYTLRQGIAQKAPKSLELNNIQFYFLGICLILSHFVSPARTEYSKFRKIRGPMYSRRSRHAPLSHPGFQGA